MLVTNTDPAPNAVAVDPSESPVLNPEARALYVGQEGDVELVTKFGNTVTFENVAAGTILPVQVRQVLASGTTADGILALW